MKRTVGGIAYDTEASRLVASWRPNNPRSAAMRLLYELASDGSYFEVATDDDGATDEINPLSNAEVRKFLSDPLVQYPVSIQKRRLVLASTAMLKALGHSGFERVLLELGVPQDVGNGSGLMARSNSLARYVLSNPGARAADGSPLPDAIIRRAKEIYDRGVTANVSDQERREFEAAAGTADGSPLPDATINSSEDFFARAMADPPKLAHGITMEKVVETLGESAVNLRPSPRRKVFIVHGHDDGSKEAVARYLTKLEFEPIILHERPNRGRTIITKFQQEAADVGFAVVLMTPDDSSWNETRSAHGGAITHAGELRSRARQNVVFELGYFIGTLGPEKVVALVKGEVERPSDIDGVIYIDLDTAGAWRSALARELEAAGFVVNMNLVLK